jgi:CheY-like chemotaxis protein
MLHDDDPSVIPLQPGPLVLVVAEAQTPRVLTAQMVRTLGYQVRTCSTSPDALGFLHTHAGQVRLLLTELDLRDMDGGELAERARDLDAHLHVVLMVARNDPRVENLRAGHHDLTCLSMPARFEDLAETLGRLLGEAPGLPNDPPSWDSRRLWRSQRRASGPHEG